MLQANLISWTRFDFPAISSHWVAVLKKQSQSEAAYRGCVAWPRDVILTLKSAFRSEVVASIPSGSMSSVLVKIIDNARLLSARLSDGQEKCCLNDRRNTIPKANKTIPAETPTIPVTLITRPIMISLSAIADSSPRLNGGPVAGGHEIDDPLDTSDRCTCRSLSFSS